MLAAGLERYGDQLKKEGIQQGLLQKQIEIAMNLYKEGTELEFISKITGFTIKEIEDLIK